MPHGFIIYKCVFVTLCLHELSVNTLNCLCRRVVVYVSLIIQMNIFVQMIIPSEKQSGLKLFNVKSKYGSSFPKTPFTCKTVELG